MYGPGFTVITTSTLWNQIPLFINIKMYIKLFELGNTFTFYRYGLFKEYHSGIIPMIMDQNKRVISVKVEYVKELIHLRRGKGQVVGKVNTK